MPASLAVEWRTLCEQVDGSSYFQTPDWVISWWETLAEKPPTTLNIWRNPAGELEALAALSQVRERLHPSLPLSVKLLTNAGSGIGGADHCGWPALPGRRAEVEAWLGFETAGRSMVLGHLDLDARIAPAGARLMETTPCPRLSVPAGAINPGRSSNARGQIRARRRKAEAAGITFREIPAGEMTPALLTTLMDLHEARWEQRRGARSCFARARLDLHRRLIAVGAPGRGPGAMVAEHEGRVVAMVYGFWWQGTFSFFQSGWDPEWAALGLATALHGWAIEQIAGRGGGTYDFLRGAEEYKYRFGSEDRVDETWTVYRGLPGRLIELKNSLKRRAGRLPTSDPISTN